MTDQPVKETGQPEEKIEGQSLYRFRRRINRRSFLKLAGMVTTSVGVGLALDSCQPSFQGGVAPGQSLVPVTAHYPEVPQAPNVPPSPAKLEFFTPEEAKMVETLTARLMPGTPNDPGAREANVTNYIDNTLAYNQGFVEPAYMKGPFAKAYEGDTPPGPDTDTVVYVKKSELERYGYQTKLTPAEIYRKGLKEVTAYAKSKFKTDFGQLNDGQVDQILVDMEAGKTTGFTDPTDKVFFKMLMDHTIQGMFADPAYGGNKDMVGWKLIRYPGAQRAYTPVDLHSETRFRPPQSLAMLHPARPGVPTNPNEVLPQSGSNDHSGAYSGGE